jgi:hypothetical protein
MSPETRLEAATAFWSDDESPDIQLQQSEAIVAIARKMNFRPRSVQAMPADRLAKGLARLSEVSDSIATRALIAFHFDARRELMGAFLDALGIEHDQGTITDDEGVSAPSHESLTAAIEKVRESFPEADVTLYMRTLSALDAETWGNLDGLIDPSD